MSDAPTLTPLPPCPRWYDCNRRDEEYTKQIDKLWAALHEKEEARVADLKENNKALQDLALKIEGMQGRALGIMMAMGGVLTVLSLILQIVFRK